MRKTFCSLGLAGLLLGGCAPPDSGATPTPAATSADADMLPHDVASVDLMEPGQQDTVEARAGQATQRGRGIDLPDQASLPGARTGSPVKAPQKTAGLSVEAEVAGLAQQGHQAERELADLAKSRSDNSQVRYLAQMLDSDHKLAAEKLRSSTLTALPEKAQLTPKEKAVKQKLARLDGASFDRAYVEALVQAQSETLAMYSQQARKAPTEALRAYFKGTRPMIEEHLKRSKSVQSTLE